MVKSRLADTKDEATHRYPTSVCHGRGYFDDHMRYIVAGSDKEALKFAQRRGADVDMSNMQRREGDIFKFCKFATTVVRSISVDVLLMKTTRGPDYFVQITCDGRSVTPHVFRERFKAEYEVAHYRWIFGLREDEPDLMAYNETAYPNRSEDYVSGKVE